MKKRCLLLCLMTVLLCLFAGSALAAQSGYYYYEDHGDGTCTILDYAGPSLGPVFPETLDSLTVTGIDEYVFRLASNSQASMGIQSVTLPDTVTTIAANAFEGCGNMTQITFGSGVQTIGKDAFRDCSRLKAVYVPSLESWLGISFANSYSKPHGFELYVDGVLAENVVIPSDVTDINFYAFEYCYSLTSVTIPGSVKTIHSCAFGECRYLQSVTISEGVESIDASAFYQCDGLYRVAIPSSVTYLSSSAFSYCDNIFLIDYTAHTHAPGAGGDSVNWYRWDGESTLTLTSGDNYVALACDVYVPSGITVSKGQHLHLCLDGSDLAANGSSCSATITVNEGGTLSLCDCSAQSDWGRVTSMISSCRGVSLNAATMYMYSGKVADNVYTSDGAGVSVYSGSAFTMYDGEISGNNDNGRNFIHGAGVLVDYSSTFTMHGGKISGNSGERGAGVRVSGSSSMYMHGGEISGNAAVSGGAIYTPGNNVTIEITGGTITGNTATGCAAIFNNASPESSASIRILGGSITGNHAESGYGGINGPVTLGGSAVITGNTSAGKASNLASGSDLITLEGEFTGTVGVTPTIPASGSFTPFLTRNDGAVTAEDLSHFQADNTSYALYVDENGQGVLGQKTYTLTLENAETEDDQTTVSVAPGTEVTVYPVVPEGQVFVQWENGAGEVLSTEKSALTFVMPLGDDTVRAVTVDPFVITEKDDGTVDVTIYGLLSPELGAEMMAEVGERSIDTFTIQTEVVVNCGNDIVIPAATVVNHGYIASGTFSGAIINQFVISGGTFTGTLENHGSFYPKFTLSADTVELYDTAVTVTSSLNVSGSSWEWYIAEDVYSDGVLVEGATGDTYRHELLKNGSVYPVQVIPTTKGEVRLKGPRATAAIVDYNIEPIDSYYATIVRCNLQDEVIEIPRSVKGYAIKNIASGAFTSCNPNATITYSGYISEAPEDAFLPTQHVWHITVPTLYSYRGPATEITLPATIEELWTGAFRYNTTLTSISGPAVTNVGVNAFTGCKSLVHASFPAATNYGYAAFSSCVVLESVDRGENPQPLTIGQLAFNCCYKLTGFDFTNVTSLAASVFAACHELGDVHLPDSLTAIGEGAFPESTVIYSSATAYARTWARENLYTWKHEQHTEEVRAAVEPTCTQSGRTEGLWCAECGEIFVAQELIPALGHTTVTDEAVEPTCTSTGLTEGSHCETCGEVFVEQEVLEALGHTEATIPGFEPTCTEPGVKDYIFCETCGEEFQTADEIPALGHTDEISKEAIAPTCTEEASTEEHACAVCGEVLVPAQTLAPQGHSEYESVGAVAPDCVHAGHTAEIICGVCGVVLTPSEEIPALGHTEEVLEAVAPTCTETGLTEGSRCTICGETIIAQEVVDALGHTVVTDAAVAPTDRETGLTEGSHCGVCGEVLTAQEVVIPANFNWDGDVITGYNRENPVVVIPADAVGLSDTAFKNNTFITSVTMGDNILSLGTQTFMGCTGLTDVYLPDHLSNIGAQTFYGVNARVHCSAESATAVALSYRGVPFTTEDGWTLRYRVTSLTGTPSATWIVKYAGGETDVVVPQTVNGKPVTQIGARAFADCAELQSVTLPDGITSVEAGAVAETTVVYCCPGTASAAALTAAGISYTEFTYYTYTDNGDGTCTITGYTGNETNVVVPSVINGLRVTSLGYESIAKKENMLTLTIPEGVTSLASFSCYGNPQLKEIKLPSTATELGYCTFADCKSLTTINLPEKLTCIPVSLFSGCSSMTHLQLPESLTEISTEAFRNCVNLTRVYMPDNVSTIASDSFYACDRLTVEVAENSLSYSTCKKAGVLCVRRGEAECEFTFTHYAGEGLAVASYEGESSEITIPRLLNDTMAWTVTVIADGAFQNNTNLTSVTMTDGLCKIGSNAFGGCTSLTSVVLPESILDISDSAFADCPNLVATVVEGTNAHSYCVSFDIPYLLTPTLRYEYVDNGDGTATITGFTGNEMYVDLPEEIAGLTVTGIGERAFADSAVSQLIWKVYMHDAITSIGKEAFQGLRIESIDIPNSVTSIGDRAFSGCTRLDNVTIPESVTSIGGAAFAECTSLTTLRLPANVTSIGGTLVDTGIYPILPQADCPTVRAFIDNDTDAHYFVVEGHEQICLHAGKDEEGTAFIEVDRVDYTLAEAVIPEGVTAIGWDSFMDHPSLTSVVMPDSVTRMEYSTFARCPVLEKIKLSANLTVIPSYAFEDCVALKHIEIPEGVEVISSYVFDGCTNLEWMTIPDSVAGIHDNAFANCPSCLLISSHEAYARTFAQTRGMAWQHDAPIPAVRVLPATRESDGMTRHEYCSGCGEMITAGTVIDHSRVLFLPAAIREIADEAFVGNKAVQITLPEGAQSIGSRAFADCDNLLLVVIPSTVSSIADDALAGCEGVTLVISADNAYALAWAEAHSADVFVP